MADNSSVDIVNSLDHILSATTPHFPNVDYHVNILSTNLSHGSSLLHLGLCILPMWEANNWTK